MKKFIVLSMVFMLFSSLIFAQDDETIGEYVIITPDNADQLVQVGIYNKGVMGVSAIAYSPDGQTIALAQANRLVLYDALLTPESEQILELDDYEDIAANSMIFNPEGDRVVVATNYTAIVWDIETGEQIFVIEHIDGWVNDVAYHPSGDILATASNDNTVRLSNADTGSRIRTLQGHELPVLKVVYSPDGDTLITASQDETLRIWNANNGATIHTLEGHRGWVWSVAYHPNGDLIASASLIETDVFLWDVDTGDRLGELRGHNNSVNAIAFSPDGLIIATVSTDKTLRVWHVETGDLLAVIDDYEGSVNRVIFSPDGRFVATVSENLYVQVFGVPLGE